MKLPEVISHPASLNGRWKSTTHLHNDAGEDVTIIFEFKDGKGSISFNEPGNLVCTASVSVKVDKNVMYIDQQDEAACGNSKRYGRYSFRCVADKNGYADCVGQNKAVAVNRFNFNLIKIN